jgi:hypothetical protein
MAWNRPSDTTFIFIHLILFAFWFGERGSRTYLLDTALQLCVVTGLSARLRMANFLIRRWLALQRSLFASQQGWKW